jgi:hypothetical protein
MSRPEQIEPILREAIGRRVAEEDVGNLSGNCVRPEQPYVSGRRLAPMRSEEARGVFSP